jgi:hypothetical protein
MAVTVLDVLGEKDVIAVDETHRDPDPDGGVAHLAIIRPPGSLDTNSCSMYGGGVGTSVREGMR